MNRLILTVAILITILASVPVAGCTEAELVTELDQQCKQALQEVIAPGCSDRTCGITPSLLMQCSSVCEDEFCVDELESVLDVPTNSTYRLRELDGEGGHLARLLSMESALQFELAPGVATDAQIRAGDGRFTVYAPFGTRFDGRVAIQIFIVTGALGLCDGFRGQAKEVRGFIAVQGDTSQPAVEILHYDATCFDG